MKEVTAKATTDVVSMTEKEAVECIYKINRGVKELRLLLFELHERKGWKVLGYDSWRDCVNERFTLSQSYLYRQVSAALVEQVISPNGEIGVYNESVLRPISSLSDDESMKEAWGLSMDKAAKEDKDLPTSKITKAVVLEMTGQEAPTKSSDEFISFYYNKITKNIDSREDLEKLIKQLENKLNDLS
jgi:hypothetical protein